MSITEKNRELAERFLENALLSDPDLEKEVDLSPGSSARDLLVTGLSVIVAHLQDTASEVREHQSLRRLALLPPSQERDEAVDDVLSNLFIYRRGGHPSRGPVHLRYNEAPDVIRVPQNARVYRSAELAFKPDSDSDQVFFEDDLTPVRNFTGDIVAYDLVVNFVSLGVGERFDIAPGRFNNFSLFSPAPDQVFSEVRFAGGKGVEDTDDLLDRAPDVLSVRSLVSERSIRTVLMELFPSILKIVTVGFGDREMGRDRLGTEIVPTPVHAGGCVDVHVHSTPLTNRVFEAEVGGLFTDPRPDITILRDESIPDFTEDVEPGMVLKIQNAAPGEADTYTITGVSPTYIRISERTRFPGLREDVEYSVGRYAPNYTDVISSSETGEFSNQVQKPGSVFLPGVPIDVIKSVSVEDPGNPLADPETGRVHLDRRLNASPSESSSDWFCLTSHNPLETPSAVQVLEMHVGEEYNGLPLRVRYDTISDFVPIHSHVRDQFHRNLCANTLVKGFHPVHLTFLLRYTLKQDRDVSGFDPEALKESLAEFINGFPPAETLNLSDIIHRAQTEFDQISSAVPHFEYTLESGIAGTLDPPNTFIVEDVGVEPFNQRSVGRFIVVHAGSSQTSYEIASVVSPTEVRLVQRTDMPSTQTDQTWSYQVRQVYGVGFVLQSPEGREIPYYTQDVVEVKPTNLVRPLNPLYALDVRGAPSSIGLGISLRTLKYICSPDLIKVERV